MRIIELDATNWRTVSDFYDALLAAIGAPKGHGRSPDALIDSMVWGGMNAVDPPYTVKISGTETLPKDVRDYIEDVKQLLAEGRVYRKRHNGDDVEVSIKIARAGGGDVLDDHEAARAVPVEYEGPDPRLRLIVDHLRRQLKPGSSRK